MFSNRIFYNWFRKSPKNVHICMYLIVLVGQEKLFLHVTWSFSSVRRSCLGVRNTECVQTNHMSLWDMSPGPYGSSRYPSENLCFLFWKFPNSREYVHQHKKSPVYVAREGEIPNQFRFHCYKFHFVGRSRFYDSEIEIIFKIVILKKYHHFQKSSLSS